MQSKLIGTKGAFVHEKKQNLKTSVGLTAGLFGGKCCSGAVRESASRQMPRQTVPLGNGSTKMPLGGLSVVCWGCSFLRVAPPLHPHEHHNKSIIIL